MAKFTIKKEGYIKYQLTTWQGVVEMDGVAIGTGKPGEIALRLREIYLDESRKKAI